MLFKTTSKKGSIAMEALLAISLSSLTVVGLCSLCFFFFAKQLQMTEIYFLARSRMYGNTNICASNLNLWPRVEALENRISCDADGSVRGELFYSDQSILTSQVRLERRLP